jgi:hypothetical protein
MTIEEAIRTAIEYETKVQRVYAEAAQAATDAVAQRVMQVLSDEEKYHIDHLHGVLDHLKRTGQVTARSLKTAIPSQKAIAEGIGKLKADVRGQEPRERVSGELDWLQRALEVEIETANFYKRMVREMGEQGETVFGRFVEIEEGHRAIVQAEMDHLEGTGYWFDFREFDQEGG